MAGQRWLVSVAEASGFRHGLGLHRHRLGCRRNLDELLGRAGAVVVDRHEIDLNGLRRLDRAERIGQFAERRSMPGSMICWPLLMFSVTKVM